MGLLPRRCSTNSLVLAVMCVGLLFFVALPLVQEHCRMPQLDQRAELLQQQQLQQEPQQQQQQELPLQPPPPPPPQQQQPPARPIFYAQDFYQPRREEGKVENIPQPNIAYDPQMSPPEMETNLYKYILRNEVTCPHAERIGEMRDGGWQVCLTPPYNLKQTCSVYSFGINNDWTFDDAIATTFGCAVKSFDPSMGVESHQRGALQWFYNMGLGGINEKRENGWELRTLGTIFNDMGEGDSIIDYLKFDIEGYELPNLEKSYVENVLPRVKQLSLELHIWQKLEPDRRIGVLKRSFTVFKTLHDLGFRRWHFHENAGCAFDSNLQSQTTRVTACIEMVYVNINFLKSNYVPSALIADSVDPLNQEPLVKPVKPNPFSSEEFVALQLLREEVDYDKLDEAQLKRAFKRKLTGRSVTCPTHFRVGRHNVERSGWDICMTPPFSPGSNCLTYSFIRGWDGIQFEDDVDNRFSCKVMSFLNRPTALLYDKYNRSDSTWLQKGGLSTKDDDATKMYTFKRYLKDHGHSQSVIDYVRFGPQDNEWEVIEEMVTSNSLKNVKQLIFDINPIAYVGEKWAAHYVKRISILNSLKKIGFYKWASHPRLSGTPPVVTESKYYRLSFINTKFIH